MKSLVSIIIPVYNAVDYVEKCLDSLIGQTYRNIEVIVVDDGSTDKTADVCDRIAGTDPRIQVIHENNQGAGAARNTGLCRAKGNYICFVDADDIVSKHYVKGLLSAIRDKELAICGFDHNVNPKKEVEKNYKVEGLDQCHIYKRMFDTDEAGEPCYGYLWNKMFHKSIIDAYDLKFQSEYVMWEDMYFCCQYAAKIREAGYVRDCLYHYNNGNEKSISHRVDAGIMGLWVEAANQIAELLRENDLYDSTEYSRLLSDLYMKHMIVYAREDRKPESYMIDFLGANVGLLRKKYKIYFKLYQWNPTLFAKLGKFMSV